MNLFHTVTGAVIFAKSIICMADAQKLQDQWVSASTNILRDIVNKRGSDHNIVIQPCTNGAGANANSQTGPDTDTGVGGTEDVRLNSIHL